MEGIVPLSGDDWAFTGLTPTSHQGAVTAVVYGGDTAISAGEDGFLGIWDIRSGQAVDRFQVSLYGITAMAKRPGRDEVCLIESDNLGYYRISAWNYRERRNIFSIDFQAPKRYVTYSPSGDLIIVAGTGRPALTTINPSTGRILNSPESLSGSAVLAASGNSQRNIMIYFLTGKISYWDIAAEREIDSFNVPANFSSTVFFSNNRYLAGVNRNGLSVVNATTGNVLTTDSSIPGDSLLYSSGDDLFCLARGDEGDADLRRYSVNNSGDLVTHSQFNIPSSTEDNRCTAAAGISGHAVLGTSEGTLLYLDNDGQAQNLIADTKTKITDIAVTDTTIAFLTGNNKLGFIPHNFNEITSGSMIHTEQNGENYNRITAFSGDNREQFILWQDTSNRVHPIIRSSGENSTRPALGNIILRSAIRTVSTFEGKALFLDSLGNLFVVSPFETERKDPFTFSSIGIIDADFVNSESVILGRSTVTPFMLLNIITGETVSLPYPSPAGLAVYRGISGKIYAAVVSEAAGTGSTVVTSIILLDPVQKEESVKCFDFPGEAEHLSLAESQDNLAAVADGESVMMTSAMSAQKPDRTPGLPLRFFGTATHIISLDRDGNISWHDNRTGKLLAIFSLQANGWTMLTEKRIITGETTDVTN